MQLGAMQLLLALFIIAIFQVSKCSLWPHVTHSHFDQGVLAGHILWFLQRFLGHYKHQVGHYTNTRWGITNTRWGITNTRWGITNTRWGITNPRWGITNTSWGITNTRLGIAAPGLDALDEPYRLAKPAQRSCFTGPLGYLRVFSILTLVIVWRLKYIFKIAFVHHICIDLR